MVLGGGVTGENRQIIRADECIIEVCDAVNEATLAKTAREHTDLFERAVSIPTGERHHAHYRLAVEMAGEQSRSNE
jgi:hypothetical protein